jgi:NAD-dependent SIR2 family protein deacetylase/tetratricopeptide (TPR) repeat protein
LETLTRDQGLSAIVDATKNTGLCLFVGAGVSVGAGLPNFKTLVWKLAESIGKTREEFDAVSNLMVLTQEYFDLRNAVSLHNTIAEQFKQVNPRPTAVHAAFAKLKTHLKFIATTNYDNLLSTALSSSQNVKVIVDAADVATLNGAFGIFHIHGNIDRPGSLVITLQQYLKAKKNKQTLVQQLGALAARMPIVFVGYSASDWNIQEYIYEALESFGDFKSDHFAVNLNATLPEQKSVQISFKAIGVRTIDLAITDRNQYTTELANFFDDLANRLEGASTPKQTSDSVSVVVGETVDSVSLIVDKKMLHDDWVPTFPYDRISSHHWIPRDEVTPLINQLIERQRVGIVGVQGRGGIGKTALASHICQDLENKKLFPDGIVLIRMRSRTMRNCLDELAGIFNMHELNRNDLSLEDLQKRFIKKIHQKKLLIVLDNVEKGAELDPLLDLFGKANIAVLMTARSRLTSKISWTELPMLDETQSYELLLMHCKRLKIKPEAKVKAFEREYFRGLPLAIKLAGIYLQSHVTATMESLGKRMNDGVQVLDEAGQPDDVGKSVKACFDLSWIELTKDEQQIFIACAQTWGSHIPHEALLGKVCKVMSMTSEVVNAAFDVLSNKGFLDHEETQDEGGAWSIHPILRSYGHEKAKQVGEIRDENGVSVASDIIDARLLLGFDLDEIDAKRKPFALPSKQSYLLETLEVCEIQKWTEEFHKILCHVDQELNNRGLWQQRKSWLLKALQLQPDEAQTAFYLKSIGETYARMGHKQLAIEYYKQAIVAYEILNDKAAIAWILHWMIYEVYDSNQVALVWEMSTEALWKNLAFGSRTGLIAYGGILRNLCEYGFIEQFGTDLISTKLLELSERIMISQGNAFNVGLSIKSSSSLAQMFGNHELAVAELQRLKMQCEKCDHPELLLIFQKQLLALMVKQSKPICDVLKVANEIRISARRLGESEADTYADYFESVAYFQMRDFEKGAQLIEKILSSATVNTDKSIDAHVVLAEQLIDIQDMVTAKTHLLLAESLAFRGIHPLDYARLDLLRAAIVLPIDVESA